jgi:hypothetical protein
MAIVHRPIIRIVLLVFDLAITLSLAAQSQSIGLLPSTGPPASDSGPPPTQLQQSESLQNNRRALIGAISLDSLSFSRALRMRFVVLLKKEPTTDSPILFSVAT